MPQLLQTIPVLPSVDILRDIKWYEAHIGFFFTFSDKLNAGLTRDGLKIHLQWHADTREVSLRFGHKILVTDVKLIFDEFIELTSLGFITFNGNAI